MPQVLPAITWVALAITGLGCSGKQPQACPGQGVFLLNVTSDGGGPDIPGWPPLLIDPCSVPSPTSCPQQSLQLTFTLDGPAGGSQAILQYSGATWSMGADSGTCAAPQGYNDDNTSYGSPDGGSSQLSTCDVGTSCTGGIDEIVLKISAAGVYGNQIAASVTIGQCCLVGSAVAQ